MKIFMIGLLALLLIGAGGAGGYFFFQQSAVASLGLAGAGVKAAQKARKIAIRKAEKAVAKLEFIELDPVVLPIMDAGGVTQVVTLVISLEVNGKDNIDYVKRLSPRLKDAFIRDMYGVLNRKASMEGGVIRVDKLKARLSRVSTEILGEGKINDVLLQVVNQRPI